MTDATKQKQLSQGQVLELVRLLAGPSPRGGSRNVAAESLQRKGLVLRLMASDQLTADGRAAAARYPFAVGAEYNRGRYVWGAYSTLAAATRAFERLNRGDELPIWSLLGTALEVSNAVREASETEPPRG